MFVGIAYGKLDWGLGVGEVVCDLPYQPPRATQPPVQWVQG